MGIEETIDVGKEYSPRLTDRYESQRGNKHNAEDFRNKYLSRLDNPEAWQDSDIKVTLDFSDVKTLSPGFANEAFAYFVKYVEEPQDVLERILIKNASKVKYDIIIAEVESGA